MIIAVSFRKPIRSIYGLRQLAILVVSVGLLRRTIAGTRDPVLGVVGVHHIDRGVIGKRDRLARDVLFRVIAVSRRERRAVVKAHCFRGHIIAVVVREGVVHRICASRERGRPVRDLTRITCAKVAFVDGRDDCVFAT